MGRRYTGRKTVLWRKSARALLLCQEAEPAAMAEFAGSAQLDYSANAAPKPRLPGIVVTKERWCFLQQLLQKVLPVVHESPHDLHRSCFFILDFVDASVIK